MINEIVIAIIGIVTTAAITFLANTFNKLIKNKNLSQVKEDMLNRLTNLILDSIRATQQTFVDTLKDKNVFDTSKQQEALNRTKEVVFKGLPNELLSFLQTHTPNLNDFIEIQIESTLNYLKSKNEI